MNRIATLLHLNEFSFMALIDIIIIAFLIYQLLVLIRGTRSTQMLIGIVLMVVVYFITGSSGIREFKTTHNVLGYLLFYIPFAVIVLFQNPIRRALINLGRNPFSRLLSQEETKSIDDIVLAAASMASKRIGALIVFERSIGLRNYTESGIILDANVSYDLLMNIFSPNTLLHDGAVIIAEDKIKAATCYLPLTLNPELSKDYGTRHRAGIGITEETDAIAVIISEERGVISIAREGTILEDLDARGLKDALMEYLGPSAKDHARKGSKVLVGLTHED